MYNRHPQCHLVYVLHFQYYCKLHAILSMYKQQKYVLVAIFHTKWSTRVPVLQQKLLSKLH